MSSKSLEQFNTPFVGGPNDALSRMRLRYLKAELRENDSINLRYIRMGIREFLPGMRKVINQIPLESALLVMPSTTRKNQVPALLATELKGVRPDLKLYNLTQKEIDAEHATESKIKRNYAARLSDHRTFSFSDKFLNAADRLNRSAYILDDSISTGDSAITLQRELLRSGIYARGVITAVANEKYHTRVSDLNRLYQKMHQGLPAHYAKEAFQQDLFTVYVGFPRKKLLILKWRSPAVSYDIRSVWLFA